MKKLELRNIIKEELKKIPKKGNRVINISSGWKGIVIDTNSKEDSSCVKFNNNSTSWGRGTWIANNDLKVESVGDKALDFIRQSRQLKNDWNKLSTELANPLAKMNLFVSRNAMPQSLDAGFVKAKNDLENMILKIDKFFRHGE